MGLENDVQELARRVERLEAALARLAPPPGAHSAPTTRNYPPPPFGSAPPPPPPAPGGQVPPTPPGPARHELDFELVLRWAGLGLVVLAAIFLVATAIGRGWIGPELQLLGASLAGLAFVAGALRLRATRTAWSLTFAVGGAIVLPICAAATNAGLDLLADGPALALLAVVLAGLVAVARRLDFEVMAGIGAVEGLFLLYWIGADSDGSALGSLAWPAMVAVAYIVVALRYHWMATRITITALALLLAWLGAGSDVDTLSEVGRWLALAIAAVMATAVWAAPAVAGRRDHTSPDWLRFFDHRLVLVLPVWIWATVLAIAELELGRPATIVGLAVAMVLAVAAIVGYPYVARRLLLSHTLGLAVLLTVMAVVLIDDSAVLLAALAALAAATGLLAWRYDDPLLQADAALLALVAGVWALGSMVDGFGDPQSLGQHVANGVVVALLIAAAILTKLLADDWSRPPIAAVVLIVTAWGMGLCFVAALFVHGPQGQVVVSALWAVAACAAIVVGVHYGDRVARALGMITLAGVLFKLLTVDLAEVDALWRVGLFFVIGAGLLWLAYLLPRLSTPSSGPVSAETPGPPPLA